MNSINENGCSVCQSGKENYSTFSIRLKGKVKRMYQYDYRTESGDLLATVAPTLKQYREERDIWLQIQK